MTEQCNQEWRTAAIELAISNYKPGCDFLLKDYAILDAIFKNSEAKLGWIVILFTKLTWWETALSAAGSPRVNSYLGFQGQPIKEVGPMCPTFFFSHKDVDGS